MKVGFELCPKDDLEEKEGLGRMKSEACKPSQEHAFLCAERNWEEESQS